MIKFVETDVINPVERETRLDEGIEQETKMDKFVLKFLADVLFLKQVICFDEFEDIMEASVPEDLDNIVDKILKSEYNLYRRGESYDGYAR